MWYFVLLLLLCLIVLWCRGDWKCRTWKCRTSNDGPDVYYLKTFLFLQTFFTDRFVFPLSLCSPRPTAQTGRQVMTIRIFLLIHFFLQCFRLLRGHQMDQRMHQNMHFKTQKLNSYFRANACIHPQSLHPIWRETPPHTPYPTSTQLSIPPA